MVELPKTIGGLTTLELFVVTDNLLNDLPDEMVNMTSLSELKVDGNPFDNLPRTSSSMLHYFRMG